MLDSPTSRICNIGKAGSFLPPMVACLSIRWVNWRPPENWFIPTLEELIEACEKKEGYDHFSLEHPQLGWFASIEAQDEQTYSGSHQATAEEAVARLWLALKKQ